LTDSPCPFKKAEGWGRPRNEGKQVAQRQNGPRTVGGIKRGEICCSLDAGPGVGARLEIEEKRGKEN